jgi:hypothetical protein
MVMLQAYFFFMLLVRWRLAWAKENGCVGDLENMVRLW